MKKKENESFTRSEVKSANRRYFDISAPRYEEIDGRRGEGLGSYLDTRLEEIARGGNDLRILDLGCGSGFVASRARKRFKTVIGIDISENIVKEGRSNHPGIYFSVADSDILPFPDGVFDAVVAVAVLHHLYDHLNTFREVFRVLKPGGIFYTDHDLEKRFRSIFRLPLSLYRFCRNEEKRYGKACPELTGRIYRATEIHREGLDPEYLGRNLRKAGFSSVKIRYHWLGLSPIFDRIGHLINPEGICRRGFAPSISITALK